MTVEWSLVAALFFSLFRNVSTYEISIWKLGVCSNLKVLDHMVTIKKTRVCGWVALELTEGFRQSPQHTGLTAKGRPLLGSYGVVLATIRMQSTMGQTLRHRVHPVQLSDTLGRWVSGSNRMACRQKRRAWLSPPPTPRAPLRSQHRGGGASGSCPLQ